MIWRIGLLVLSLLALNGCVAKSGTSAQEQGTVQSREHSVESEELKILMRELNLVIYDRQKSELERDDIRRRYALNLADTIKELAYKVEHIPSDVLKKRLNDAEVAVYTGYARELYRDGEQIHTVAERYELEKLDETIAKTERTCDRCHALFRE